MHVQDKSTYCKLPGNLAHPSAFIITGGCGSIGGTTARSILEKGGSVVVSRTFGPDWVIADSSDL